MKDNVTLALAAERWLSHSRLQIAGANRTLAQSEALVAQSRLYFGRMSSDEINRHIEAVLDEPTQSEPPVEVQEDDGVIDYLSREYDAAHVEDAEGPHCPATWGEPNETLPEPRVIPAPGTVPGDGAAGETESDRIEWDRRNTMDRFE